MLCAAMVLASCSDDEAPRGRELTWGVRVAWMDGRADGKTSRTLGDLAGDLLVDGELNSDLTISSGNYPRAIYITCTKGDDGDVVEDFTLANNDVLCTEAPTFWSYTPSSIYRDIKIKQQDYVFHATAVLDEDDDPATDDDGDRLVGKADKDDILHNHMQLTLHHTKALLRFGFKVSEKYSKIRYIKITGVNINDKEYPVADKVLNSTTMTFMTYFYVNPEDINPTFTTKKNTIVCTYDIYDKDAVFPTASMTDVERTAALAELDNHRTREGIKAKNTFTFNNVLNTASSQATSLQAGYYYDLRVTLNPDYLYVLSEHDNKHLTVE